MEKLPMPESYEYASSGNFLKWSSRVMIAVFSVLIIYSIVLAFL